MIVILKPFIKNQVSSVSLIGIERLGANLITRGEVMKRFKKIFWKIWVRFLVLSIPAAIITFIISACCLDSDTITPGIICLLSGAWLMILVVANSDRGKKHGNKDKPRGTDVWEVESDKRGAS